MGCSEVIGRELSEAKTNSFLRTRPNNHRRSVFGDKQYSTEKELEDLEDWRECPDQATKLEFDVNEAG